MAAIRGLGAVVPAAFLVGVGDAIDDGDAVDVGVLVVAVAVDSLNMDATKFAAAVV
jgi:hypothetical protein